MVRSSTKNRCLPVGEFACIHVLLDLVALCQGFILQPSLNQKLPRGTSL